jgi:iron complex outermembrane receptor protein
MKQYALTAGLSLASAISVVAIQPAIAQIAEIQSIQLYPTHRGLEIILETYSDFAPPIDVVETDKTLQIDIRNAQLSLEGSEFRTIDPNADIALVTATQLDPTTVRIEIVGQTTLPQVEILPSPQGTLLSVTTPPTATFDEIEEIELVVTATRTTEPLANVPRSVSIIEREQIEEQTNLTRNLADVLGQLVPGLGLPTQSISGFGQPLRGRNPVVLIDGVPQSTSRNVLRDLQTISPSAIERIEVLRGPTAIYGDGATGGVINIITRNPEGEEFTATTEVGVTAALGNLEGDSFGETLQQTLAFNENQFDFLANFSYTSTGLFYDAEGDIIPPDPNGQGGYGDARSLNFLAKLGYDIDEQQRLALSFNIFNERQNTTFTSDPSITSIPGRQKARALEGVVLDEPQSTENLQINLSYQHEDLWGSKVNAQVYYRDYQTRFFPFDARRFASFGNTIFQSYVDSEKWGSRLGIETPLANEGDLKLLWGIDYVQENTEQPVTIYDPQAFESSRGLTFRSIGDRVWTPPLKLNSLGLFAQLNWEINEAFAVVGGLRHERAGVDINDFTTLSGNRVTGGDLNFDATLFNVGLAYKPTETITTFANFSQGFSLADVGRVLRSAPAGLSLVQLRPEPQKVNNYEIGVRGDWQDIKASLAGFYNTSELGSTFDQDLTILRAPERIYGIEATLDYQPTETWLIGGSLSWVEGEIDLRNNGNYSPLDGFRISPLKLTAYVENQTLPGWSNRLQLLYSGSRDRFGNSTAFGQIPVDSYVLIDYISSINLGTGTLQIGIQNLFNSQYFPVVSQLQSGETAYAAGRGRTASILYKFTW